jgi:hypothetical protein
MRGDGREPFKRVPAAEQLAAMKALLATIQPAALALPDVVLQRLPPRPERYERTRELFPRYTGDTFDVITPAVVAATHTITNILADDRAARIVQQHAIDPSLSGLEDVIDRLFAATFGLTPANPYHAEISRAVERVVIEELIGLAASAGMPQVRAVATLKSADEGEAAHIALLARDIKRFLDAPDTFKRPAPIVVPPGAPIGEPDPDYPGWIRRTS